MPTRFLPVTDYSITHYASTSGSVRATIDLYDRTGSVTLVGTLEFYDVGAVPPKPTGPGSAEGIAAGLFSIDALGPIVDTLRHEKPLMACVDADAGLILYIGTQQLEPAGESHER